MLAPCSAAPVSSSPRIGPAHGAQSSPVATPSSSDAQNGLAAPPVDARSDFAVGQRHVAERKGRLVGLDRDLPDPARHNEIAPGKGPGPCRRFY